MKAAKALKVVIVVLLVLLTLAFVGGGLYLKDQYSQTTFFNRTKVSGYDVSGLTPQEAQSVIMADYSNISVQINEKGEKSFGGSLADFGYVVDSDRLLANLQDALARQRSDLSTMINSLVSGNSFTVTIPFLFYEDTFDSLVTTSSLKDARVESKDAQMKYNESEKYYYIEPEVYGNEFPEDEWREYVKEQLNSYVSANRPNSICVIEFPEELYLKPSVTDQDETMNETVNVYNQFCRAQITYDFGSQKQVLDWDTIQDWIRMEDGEGVISDEDAYQYIYDMAATYDTRHLTRTFHTSLGTDVTIPEADNEYGYTINQDGEFQQMIADIRGNTPVEREPVYYSTNSDYGNPLYYHRDGTDDLAGTYVEVNLTRQHMWFYKDYQLVVESDIVSGSVAKNAQTKTGAFPLAYKESPSVLVGADAADGYRTEVQYWMPFYEGQGLHDGWWRTSFGGSIYQTNGSHGCVNLPSEVARTVYENIEAGVAIIIYK